jgi:hypothetical protein
LVEDEFSTPRNIATGVTQGSVLAPILYSVYTNNAPAATGTQPAPFVDDTCIYTTEKHEDRVLCKMQRGFGAVNSWWNIMINEGKTQAVYKYFSRRLTVPEDVLQLNGQDIPFVNNVMYLGVTFDKLSEHKFLYYPVTITTYNYRTLQ